MTGTAAIMDASRRFPEYLKVSPHLLLEAHLFSQGRRVSKKNKKTCGMIS